MKVTALDRRTRQVALLRKLGATLGSVFKTDNGHGHSWARGRVIVCSSCSKVVGCIGDGLGLDDVQEDLLDPNAGWVLERRRALWWFWSCGHGAAGSCECCGQSLGNCRHEQEFDYPVACSDACEMALLGDRRFERCDPPPDYQRGEPHP